MAATGHVIHPHFHGMPEHRKNGMQPFLFHSTQAAGFETSWSLPGRSCVPLPGLPKPNFQENTDVPLAFCNFSAAPEIDADNWVVHPKYVHNLSQLVGRLRRPINFETLRHVKCTRSSRQNHIRRCPKGCPTPAANRCFPKRLVLKRPGTD
jgi:hypothetical protein